MEDEEVDETFYEILTGSSKTFVSDLTSYSVFSAIAFVATTFAGPGAYGVFKSIIEVSKNLLMFSSGGIHTSLLRTVPRLDTDEKNSIFTFSFVIVLVLSSIISICIYLFRDLLIEHTVLNSSQLVLFLIAVFFLTMVLKFMFDVSQSFKKMTIYNGTRVFRPVLELLVISFVMVFISSSVHSLLWSALAALLVSIIVSWYLVSTYTSFKLRRFSIYSEELYDFVSYLIPTVLATMLHSLQYFSISVLMIFLSPVQAGIYGISLILSMFVRFPLKSINSIYPQIGTEIHDNNETQTLEGVYAQALKIVIFISSPIAAFLIVYHYQISIFFSNEYASFAIVIPVMILGQLFASYCGSIGLTIMIMDNERANLVLQGGITIIILPLAVYLTMTYGVYGLALAKFTGLVTNNLVEVLFMYYYEEFFPYNINHAIAIASFGLLTAIMYVLNIASGSIIITGTVSLVLIITYYYVVFQVIFTGSEKNTLKTVLVEYVY